IAAKLLAQLRAARPVGVVLRAERLVVRGAGVALVVIDRSALEPSADRRTREAVLEVLAPDRAVPDARLRPPPLDVQHADQPRPLAGPVGESEDRSAVFRQTREDVARVLPDGLGHDERRVGIDLAEDLDTLRLTVDEAVLLFGVVRVPARDPRAELAEGLL